MLLRMPPSSMFTGLIGTSAISAIASTLTRRNRADRIAPARSSHVVLAALLAGALLAGSASAQQLQLGGPVIIGGDDADDHGSVLNGVNQDGWLYIEDGFNNIGPAVANRNMIATCLGCNGSSASRGFESGFDLSALPALGWTRAALTSDSDIANFFNGTGLVNLNNAGIIYMPTDAHPVTGVIGGITTTQINVVNNNADALNDFVRQGGGLFTHNQQDIMGGFGWLTKLLPDISINPGGSCDQNTLNLTPTGRLEFPQLTDTIVSSATPWHTYFSGNLGGLDILVTGLCLGLDQPVKPVIIGGSRVIPGADLVPVVAFNPPGTNHTVTATLNEAGSPRAGVDVTFEVLKGGANAGVMGTTTTDGFGEADFTYTSNGSIGVDTIVASFEIVPGNRERTKNDAFKFWDLDCQLSGPGIGVPDTCDIDCAGFSDLCLSGFPVECGRSLDINPSNGVPDECEVVGDSVHEPVRSAGWAEAVAIRQDSSNRFAFVAAQESGLLIYDVTDPDSIGTPIVFLPPAGACPQGASFFADDIALSGSSDQFAVVAGGACGLVIVNVSNPSNPFLESQLDFLSPDGSFLGWAKGLEVSDDSSRAYVADYFDGLRIVDISNAGAPTIVGTRGPADDASFGNAIAVTRDESPSAENPSNVYVATTNGLRIVDVSSEGAPLAASSVGFDTSSLSADAIPQDVVVVGDVVYLPVWLEGLRVLQLNGEAAPTQIQLMPDNSTEPYFKIALSGSRVLATQGVAGLRVFRTDDGKMLIPEAQLDPFDADDGLAQDCDRLDGRCWAWNVAMVGNQAYVTFGDFSETLGIGIGGRLQIVELGAEASASASLSSSSGGGGGASATAETSRIQVPISSLNSSPDRWLERPHRAGEHIPFRIPVQEAEVDDMGENTELASAASVQGDGQPSSKATEVAPGVVSSGRVGTTNVGRIRSQADVQSTVQSTTRQTPADSSVDRAPTNLVEPILIAAIDSPRDLNRVGTLENWLLGANDESNAYRNGAPAEVVEFTGSRLTGNTISIDGESAGSVGSRSLFALIAIVLSVPFLVLWRRRTLRNHL